MSVVHTPLSPLTSITAPLALYGGTFDPVHNAHLRVASDTAQALGWPEVRLIPSKAPVHRSRPGATDQQRMAMLKLAVNGYPQLVPDSCELDRNTPSYTVFTLEAFRACYPQRPLIWLTGVDAFLRINTWYQWQRLFDLAHFVVLNRPGYSLDDTPPELRAVCAARNTDDAQLLRQQSHGRIYWHHVSPQTGSATEIRTKIASGCDDAALKPLLPATVLAYIRAHRLYLA